VSFSRVPKASISGVDRAVPKEGTVSKRQGLAYLGLAVLGMSLFQPVQAQSEPARPVPTPAQPAPEPPSEPEPEVDDQREAPGPETSAGDPVANEDPTSPTSTNDTPGTGQPERILPAPPALLDDAVIPAQNAPPAGGANLAVPYTGEPASLPTGAQAVGVTVQVVAPAAMTLHKPATVTILVKNNGTTDALGVVVRDQLPDGVKYVKSVPEASTPPAGTGPGGFVVWNLGTLAAGAERKLAVTVEPVEKGPQDHAATVMLSAGSRARSVVRQPILHIEQTVSKSSVRKGQQVRFDVTIVNNGDGPARDVVVRADLSPGLRHDPQGNLLELSLAEQSGKSSLGPGESIQLPALVVDAVSGGEHTCTVTATSPDVVEGDAGAKSVKSVTITEPRLLLTLDGPRKRYTDNIGEYTITLTNPGTAAAREVRIAAKLTGNGRAYPAEGAQWIGSQRTLVWTVPQIEPNSRPLTYKFRVRYEGLGTFQVHTEATARDGLRELKDITTSIEGNALVELAVTEDLKVLDVGQSTVFKIRLHNLGTKEAQQVQVNAELTPTLKAIQTAGTDLNEKAQADEATRTKVVFPTIPRIPPGGEVVLAIEAEAISPGLAACRVFVAHQDLAAGGRLEGVSNATVTDSGAPLKE
jgi:uncharacterized repeat protein (TIGR01451 family)